MNIPSDLEILRVLVLCVVIAVGMSCGTTGGRETVQNSGEPVSQPANEALAPEPEPELDPAVIDRLKNERWTGDIDGLVERRYIRALVLYNKTNFFYDGPQPRGISYEALKEFEKFLNKRLNTGDKPVHMVFIPVSRDEALKRMAEGRADIAASNIPIVRELQQIVDFSDPVRERAKQIVVTGPSGPELSTMDDLSGKEVFVRKRSRYWPNLERLNRQFTEAGKPAMILKEADNDLEDEDLLDMVNAGLVGMTVMDDMIAGLWAKVHEGLNVRDDLVLAGDDKIGWAVQKGTPRFTALMNEFVKDHRIGTSFGNSLLLKYLKDTKWVKNSIAAGEMEKYRVTVGFFKKYAAKHDFDWLMIAAQAYQESTIDQSKVSPAGAYGVMQIKPSTAAGDPINISNIDTNIENNINAGVKYMGFIMDRYFKDASINRLNRGLFAFASYNAGPARVAKLRKQAESEGLDPNIWFNNVELIAAKEIGAETVTYVSNIYKYYIAYKMVSREIAPKRRKTV